jgi:hypothetical protein
MKDKGFLSRDITVADLITHRGDVHHIFPKDYLKKNGITQSQYNQVANYAYMQSEINIAIGNRSPLAYFNEMKEQCDGGPPTLGGISDLHTLKCNLAEHCIPEGTALMEVNQYDAFLQQRRMLMAKKMRDYYWSL